MTEPKTNGNLPLPLPQKQMALLMAMLVALMPFSTDAYLPAIPEMAQALGADIHRIEQSLGMFLFGVAFGQLIGGSVSDIKGRKPVALAGLAVHLVSVIGLIFITSAEQLLLLRAVQAFGAGMTVVVVGATVRDYYDGRQAAQMFALIGIILMIVPLMSPMLGSVLLMIGGWRSIFGFLMVYTLLLLVLIRRFLPAPVKTDKIGADIFGVVAGRFKRVLSTRGAMGFLFFQAFSFASMFAFLTESSFVYMKLYGLSSHGYALVFALNIITMATFNRVTAWRLKTGVHPQNILRWGIIMQFTANLTMVLLVLLLKLPPLWALVMCVMFSVGTQGLVGANTQACFMAYFKAEGGSANAVLGVCQSVIGASMGLLTTWLHNGSALVMAGMMLTSTVCGIVLLWGCSHQAWIENDKNKEAFK
ncbi:multidrug effflux MFS transporter [Neisseria perflava]|uniref:multidrug effflux MFS transporter n=1 Tax=Neisseria perflava TaxID=33053 RepID=UPI0020A1F165|nr:multidrug effflux MFS transporter [Neisseria perflava]MCP1659398.1 DHA1 family bicyclomycin/chloramphenicol resistance-like MFS transporter [Neisseria perflava]MCP1772159.1 DHA1 family bicyclomycin/chloramphenicol resistance-like MFS transporter [Neisseria perflava]